MRPELLAVLRQRRDRERAEHQRQIARPVRAVGAQAGDQRQQNAGEHEIASRPPAGGSAKYGKVGRVLRRIGRGGGGADGEIHEPERDVRAPARPSGMVKQAADEPASRAWLSLPSDHSLAA